MYFQSGLILLWILLTLQHELKKDQKKEALVNKIPEKPANEESNGSLGLSSDAIIRIPKRGARNRRRRCQVAFSYMPQNEDELELKVGEIIEVLGETLGVIKTTS